MKLRGSLLVLALFATAASASAQYRGGTVEINPFAGYLFGGNLGHFHDFNSDDFDHTHLDVEDHVTYGGRVGYNFTNLWEAELEYAQSDTHLELDSHHDNVPDQRFGDLRFQYFMAYMTLNFGHGRFVPYFTLGSGAANLRQEFPGSFSNSEVRYTAGVGGGVKIFVTPHFAFRLDGRSYSTYLSDHSVCGPDFCSNATWVSNFVANGGFVVAF